jgi:hypothetical protein
MVATPLRPCQSRRQSRQRLARSENKLFSKELDARAARPDTVAQANSQPARASSVSTLTGGSWLRRGPPHTTPDGQCATETGVVIPPGGYAGDRDRSLRRHAHDAQQLDLAIPVQRLDGTDRHTKTMRSLRQSAGIHCQVAETTQTRSPRPPEDRIGEGQSGGDAGLDQLLRSPTAPPPDPASYRQQPSLMPARATLARPSTARAGARSTNRLNARPPSFDTPR